MMYGSKEVDGIGDLPLPINVLRGKVAVYRLLLVDQENSIHNLSYHETHHLLASTSTFDYIDYAESVHVLGGLSRGGEYPYPIVERV